MQLDEMIQEHTVNLSPQLKAEIFDFVLFVEQKQKNSVLKERMQNKQQLKQDLENAVALNIFAGIDGVEWQREQRQDNVLFGRDE
jgi:hypothetical protein